MLTFKQLSEKKKTKVKINPSQKELTEKKRKSRPIDKDEPTTCESVDLTEEWVNASVEVAAEYFYAEGINEDGLDNIINEVGLEDFVEFVIDPIEELNEERSARKASVKAPSYEKVKAKVDAADAAKKKAGKGEYSSSYKKKETDVTDYGDKVAKVSVKKVKKSVAKAKAAKPAPRKQKGAMAYDGPNKPASEAKDRVIAKTKAKREEPKKKAGLASKIGGALKKGVERHKAARAKGKTAEKRVKEFGKGFASGVKDTVKFAGKVKKAVVGETLQALLDTLEEGAELDIYDTVVAYLIDEQLAQDFDGANKIMATLKHETIDEVYEQQLQVVSEAERDLGDRLHRKRKLYDKTTKKAMQFARDEGEASGHARYRMSSISREMDGIRAKMKKEK